MTAETPTDKQSKDDVKQVTEQETKSTPERPGGGRPT